MLDDLNELRTFLQILASGSLSGAAREMNATLAVVSKRLASLERRVGQRLIQRTTRKLTATDDGLTLLPYVERILDELAAAETLLANDDLEPRGVLRVSCTVTLARTHVAPVAAALTSRYPRLQIELHAEDRLFDLVEERIDIAIHVGTVPDNSYVMRTLTENQRILVASPCYLNRHGRPERPEDLQAHTCLRWRDGKEPWVLRGPGGEAVEVETRSQLRSTNGDIVQEWARAGLGIMMKSRVDLFDDLASGTLERVLTAWQGSRAPICALMPSRRYLTARAKVFLDALTRRLAL
jgi:LysR family transcriptional regulator, transcriptional activator for dmlA